MRPARPRPRSGCIASGGGGGLGHPLADLGRRAEAVSLSRRELEVLRLLACGQANSDVDWASCPDSHIAPWHGIHRGKAEVPNFFLEESLV